MLLLVTFQLMASLKEIYQLQDCMRSLCNGVQVASLQKFDYVLHGEEETGKRLMQLDVQGGNKQVLEADLVLWTAGSTPVSRGEMKLKV